MSCLSSDTTAINGSMDASRGEEEEEEEVEVEVDGDDGCKSESLAHSIE